MKRLTAGDWLVIFITACFVIALVLGLFVQEKKHEAFYDIAIER